MSTDQNEKHIFDISEDTLLKILEVIPDATLIVNDQGLIAFANNQTAKLFKYEKQELIGQKLEILIPEPYRSRHAQHLINYFKTPRTRAMGSGMELFGQRKDGEIFSVEISLNPIETKSGMLAIAVIRDITHFEILFKQFAENIKEVFFLLPSDMSKFIYISPAYQEIWGKSIERLKANPMDWLESVIDEDKNTVNEHLERIKTQPSSSVEYRILHPDGSIKIIYAKAFQIKDKVGNFTKIIGIATDMTEFNQLKAQAHLNDKLKIIGTLAASIAHEINNPIAWILGNLEYIQKHCGTLNSIKLEELVNESILGAERIRDIVRNLKGFARIDNSVIKMLDLHPILDSVITMTALEIKLHARLETQYATNLPLIKGNSGKLHQVFLNLIMNAIQAIPEGDVQKNRIIIKTQEENNYVKIDIIDTGVGISSKVLPKIFDPFFTTKSAEIGTGLGLSISLEIIKNLGGNITVKSKEGTGTTFSVYLPITNNTTIKSNESKSLETSSSIKHKNILVIDDETLLLNSMQRLLNEYHTVITASNGKKALELLKENSFDVIILDLNMPEMNGKDIYQYIAKNMPGFEKRIIFMTGGSYTDELKVFIHNVNNFKIEKPFEQSDLLKIIAKVNV